MKTRTLAGLQTRCIRRGIKTAGVVGHVRAELDRLARQIQRLERYKPEATNNVFLYYQDVRDLIKEAKQ